MSTMPVLAIGSDRHWRARLERILSGRGELSWLGARDPDAPGHGPRPTLMLLDGDDPQVECALRHLRMPTPQRLYFFRHPDAMALRDCVNAGAAGCLDKEASAESLLRAIRSVGLGLFVVDPTLLRALVGTPGQGVSEWTHPEQPPGNWSQLTQRQREIVCWAAQGLSNKQIARHLGISPETVKCHLHHVFERAGVSGRMALLAAHWTESELLPATVAPTERVRAPGDDAVSSSDEGDSGRRDVA